MIRDNVKAARELRQRMTPAETRLWTALRGHRLAGVKVRRQHPVGPYVLDFAIPTARLGVELDGAVHDGQREDDAARAANLAELGWRLLRFRNDVVFDDLGFVLDEIRRAALTPRPSPIAMGEGSTNAASDAPSCSPLLLQRERGWG